jgi:type IV secretory pathway VirB2 component (pilin)
MNNLVCPISDQRVNEQVTRFNAMFTIGIIVLAFVLNSVSLFVFLMADFFIRAFTEIKFSPLSYASHHLSNAFHFPVRMIDKAPKIFAARLGFLMTIFITGLFVFGLKILSIIVAGIMIVFASLEFLFAICVGCMIYTYLVLPFYKK